ncbi:forkhead box Q2 [Melanotaenia boesemani]|uniref:forkhead box Q2 n=1 Tax=Melanotaenia boesemani TaxID=1250792 RepID=UPI001C05ACC8|nr:forkhead box Q2 [Melanotaenia boesemani]
MTTENRSSRNGSRDRLGLSFTIDYLLYNRGVKGSKEEAMGSGATEQTENGMQNHQNPKLEEVGSCCGKQGKRLQQSEAKTEKSKASEEEVGEEQQGEGEEKVTTTTTSISSNLEKSMDKPNQSYIALISKAILESEEKKLLLCDIYQWIMDHYPYFKSKDKNWRNSVRHNLSLNDCFIKAGRSDNGKGHFWAIHPANFQDFSKGDYHCRRARRRVRKVVGQLRLSSLTPPYYPAATPTHLHRTVCWCCPQGPLLPLSCLAPKLYWPWSSIQPQVGLHLGLNASVP